ncbi:MAG: alkaline phosphatase family protein, partial [Candidatus Firestonebacteria bacterium]
MKKFLLGLLLLPFLVVFLFGAEGNAVLFSWDGAGRENVLKFADEGKLPVIESLRKTGAFVEIKITGHATSTGPAHANMLTGFGPEVNLVQSNSSYFSIPAGLTLGERLEKTLGPDNIFTIMVMGKLGYMGAAYGQPYNNAVKALDVWDGDKDKRDATVVAG